MAIGWSRDGAVQNQIDATINDAIDLAKNRLPEGESSTHCEKCEAVIPEPRRKAVPGVRFCIKCQAEFEKQLATVTGPNRRSNKDSQLK